VHLRFNYRVYPAAGQQVQLARAFGCARVVFNDGLRLRQQAREAGEKYVSDAELSKRVITQAKATPHREWLGEVSSVVLQQSLADLNVAYRNFFASISGKRKGRTVAPRMCSTCGRINDKMALDVRAWDCPCGAAHDRDVNAAKNVLAAGQADNSNDRGVRVRPPAMAAPHGETVTHPHAACPTRSMEGISDL
jgi:transposase